MKTKYIFIIALTINILIITIYTGLLILGINYNIISSDLDTGFIFSVISLGSYIYFWYLLVLFLVNQKQYFNGRILHNKNQQE